MSITDWRSEDLVNRYCGIAVNFIILTTSVAQWRVSTRHIRPLWLSCYHHVLPFHAFIDDVTPPSQASTADNHRRSRLIGRPHRRRPTFGQSATATTTWPNFSEHVGIWQFQAIRVSSRVVDRVWHLSIDVNWMAITAVRNWRLTNACSLEFGIGHCASLLDCW